MRGKQWLWIVCRERTFLAHYTDDKQVMGQAGNEVVKLGSVLWAQVEGGKGWIWLLVSRGLNQSFSQFKKTKNKISVLCQNRDSQSVSQRDRPGDTMNRQRLDSDNGMFETTRDLFFCCFVFRFCFVDT